MELKGTRTEQNIKAALAGESIARNKYTYYAEQARKEGHPEIAELFERMAGNESIHAKIWYTNLNGPIKGNMENLRSAASGEFEEWSNMYPDFAKVAREEGFEHLAVLFERVAQVEKAHEKQFMEAIIQLNKQMREEAAAQAQAAIEEEEEQEQQLQEKPGYRCIFCGAVYENRLDVCPVCEAIGSFEPCTMLV